MYNSNKIVIFDWGGIVESHFSGELNWHTAQLNILNRLNVDTQNFDEKSISKKWSECDYNENNKNISTLVDDKDVEKWLERIKAKFNFECTYSEFCKVYREETNKIVYYNDVAEYARSLKEKCKIGILSNLGKLDEERIDMHYHLNQFDHIWLSFKLNTRKPEEQIYKIVEKECKIPANNILFIDDVLENIEAAQRRGWKTCHCTGQELDKIKACVNNFLKE